MTEFGSYIPLSAIVFFDAMIASCALVAPKDSYAQSYLRLAKRAATIAGPYAHARRRSAIEA